MKADNLRPLVNQTRTSRSPNPYEDGTLPLVSTKDWHHVTTPDYPPPPTPYEDGTITPSYPPWTGPTE